MCNQDSSSTIITISGNNNQINLNISSANGYIINSQNGISSQDTSAGWANKAYEIEFKINRTHKWDTNQLAAAVLAVKSLSDDEAASYINLAKNLSTDASLAYFIFVKGVENDISAGLAAPSPNTLTNHAALVDYLVDISDPIFKEKLMEGHPYGPSGELFLAARYIFSEDGKKLFSLLGSSTSSYTDARSKWEISSNIISPIVEFELATDGPISISGSVYYGERKHIGNPEDGYIMQTKYRNNGFYFTNNFKTLNFREDYSSVYPENKGIPEFWYDSLATTSKLGPYIETLDSWIPDLIKYAIDDSGNSIEMPLAWSQVENLSAYEMYDSLVERHNPSTMSKNTAIII